MNSIPGIDLIVFLILLILVVFVGPSERLRNAVEDLWAFLTKGKYDL